MKESIDSSEQEAFKAIDPVCHMVVDSSKAPASFEYSGNVYYFCNIGCMKRFSADPQKYLAADKSKIDSKNNQADADGKICHDSQGDDARANQPSCCHGSVRDQNLSQPKGSKETTASPSVPQLGGLLQDQPVYSCPMHPEVTANQPGDCPSCGMPLEPIGASPDDGQAELKSLTNRFVITAALAAPVVILAMGHMFGTNLTGNAGGHILSTFIQLVLTTPVVFWASMPFFKKGILSVRTGNLNMFTLLSLGIAVPYFYSLFDFVTAALRGTQDQATMVYFDSSAMIATLAWLGQVLEARARHKSGSAIRELLELAPLEATVVQEDGREERRSVAEVDIGSLVRVKPGERIPLDGTVLEGRSLVDESMLTGESVPQEKLEGSLVAAGTVNGSGSLLVKSERLIKQTLLWQIAELVGQAQRSRVPVQSLADRVSAIFVPAVLIFSILTVAGWLIAGADPASALSAATAVLVIACPCALGLATPMSITVASGRAARAGVLFKEATALQALARIDVLVIDKTGTLTSGHPDVNRVEPVAGFDEKKILTLAAAVEQHSEHPLARAIMQACHQRTIRPPSAANFKTDTGLGASAIVEEKLIRVGNRRYIESAQIALPEDGFHIEDETTVVFIAVDDQIAGRISFKDTLRENASVSVKNLQARGIKVILASGDQKAAVERVATVCGINEFHHGMLPGDKVELIKALQDKGLKVAMAGDGINDAPALARADVGMALGSGTDIAMHSADIVLMNADLNGINRALKLSQAMMANIKENLILAFAYNLISVPLASGVLTPIIGFMINPMMAAAFMSISSVSVVLNALRLRALEL